MLAEILMRLNVVCSKAQSLGLRYLEYMQMTSLEAQAYHRTFYYQVTHVFCLGTNIMMFSELVTLELSKVHRWLFDRKPYINVLKNKIFANYSIPRKFSIKINDIIIKQVNSPRFFGIEIDEELH